MQSFKGRYIGSNSEPRRWLVDWYIVAGTSIEYCKVQEIVSLGQRRYRFENLVTNNK